MSAEPIVIYSHRIDPDGVLRVLREMAPRIEIENSSETWSRATIREPAGFFRKPHTLSFRHDPSYYAGPDWTAQMLGMQAYFSRFPKTPDTGRIMLLIQSFRFALTLWPMPEPDLFVDSDDARLRYVRAVTKYLDGALFLPSGFRDAAGHLLYGAASPDPRAVMPTIFQEIAAKPRSERSRSNFGTQPEPGDPPPPSGVRVARRACALAAVAGRALLEQDNPDDPQVEETRLEIQAWVDGIGVRDELEAPEAAFLHQPLGSPSRQEAVDFTWRLEGLAVLAWALGRFELPPHDQLVTPADLLRSVGILNAKAAQELLAAPALCSTKDLADQRDRLFAIHWRLTNWRVKPQPMNFEDFARTAWFGPLNLSGVRLLENDLAIREASLSRASAENIARATSAAKERHLAANWLCGDSELYSDTDAST